MRLIFVRHGQTDGNKHNVLIGHTDISLNETGQAQAQAVASRFQNEHIDAIISSDKLRAKQTAQEIARFHPHVQLQFDSRLRERLFGIHEERPYEELVAASKAKGVHEYRYQPENGESPAQTVERVLPVINELFEKYKGKTVVVVSHGTVIRSVLVALLKRTDEDFFALRQRNTGVTILSITDDGKHIAHVINDTSHLDGLS